MDENGTSGYSPLAVVVGDQNSFVKSLVTKFLEVGCGVVSLSSSADEWNKQVLDRNFFKAASLSDLPASEELLMNANYLVLIVNKNLPQRIIDLLSDSQAKTLVIADEDNYGILQTLNLNKSNVCEVFVEESARGESFDAVTEKLLHLLFSFGFPPTSMVRFSVKQFSTPKAQLKDAPQKEKMETEENKIVEKKHKKSEEQSEVLLPPKQPLIEDVKPEIKIPPLKAVSLIQNDLESPLKVESKKTQKKYWQGIVVVLLLLLSPFLFTAVGIGSLFIEKEMVLKGEISISKSFAKISSMSLGYPGAFFTSASEVPAIGGTFANLNFYVRFLASASLATSKSLEMLEGGVVLSNNILNDKDYNLAAVSDSMALKASELYRDLGFLESQASIFPAKNLMAKYFPLDQLSEYRQKVLGIEEISRQLPTLLGSDERRTYLVLFQNNMELRPTGGFIGSFSLVSFDSGRIVEQVVYDVYSADGQLKGHVEPPEPIKKYLGEANWYLRDSNWDIDFETSAARAEWFLDKEIDQQVDGVIAVDLEFVKKVLAVVGPVYVADYDINIDESNLYTKTQLQVESDFFPGSQKKANFLTALTRVLLADLAGADGKDLLHLGRAVADSLEEKHLQVYVHNNTAQNSLSVLGWTGSAGANKCSKNCFSDNMGIVEANVGVNKVNYFISRQSSLVINIDETKIERVMSVNIRNSASPDLGDKGRYKAYVRAFGNPASNFADIVVSNGQSTKSYVPEITAFPNRKEAGVLVEVLPGQSSTVTFKWWGPNSLNFDSEGSYLLTVNKQAGTISDPLVIRTYFPSGLNLESSPDFSLTDPYTFGYNTKLSRDFSSRISF